MATDTTIAVNKKTKERLLQAKQYPRETFDDLLNRLLEEHNKILKQKKNID